MRQKLILLIMAISTILFSGCGEFSNVSFNAEMNKNINKIAVIPPLKETKINIFYFNHPGMNFGLIGSVVALAEFDSKEKSYNKLIESEKFDANSYFIEKLKGYLENDKYSINLLPVENKEKFKFLKTYPEADADAYLDLLCSVGYIAGSPTSTYKPTVKLKVRLVKKIDKTIIYDKMIAIGENYGLDQNVEYIGCEDNSCYSDFSKLKENPKQSIDGLKISLDKIAYHVANSLKK
ncbi:exported hypothetical protein [Sulfurovum sp. enrichment culture clone C5]|uniref:Lipoprotein n=1 Tax=Sulfurovum sp. enrichment culture clone C5 TaxID=497650 RepID=A0A0S4XLW7_9BACT|nr:exported hypothetical protein [Sulfurovum sp. enrichment culture clone C5]